MQLKNIIEIIIIIITILIIGLMFRTYVTSPTKIKQESMFPTLKENEKLWINKTIKITKKIPKRGEIITFKAPTEEAKNIDNPIAQYKNEKGVFNRSKTYIKRVIALPGEHLEIKDNKVYINDKELQEDYLQDTILTKVGKFNNFTVPKNCIFVMGDNREKSFDSRDFGCIPIEKIEGSVFIRTRPFSRGGKVR